MRLTILFFSLLFLGWFNSMNASVLVGAEQAEKYLPLLEGKKVALVVNQTSMVRDIHLLDFLIDKQIEVIKIFSPEHGFRGDADAGKNINDQVDEKTGLPIVSLYGENKKPTSEQLSGVDLVIFDIQDVGVRFYTYISTLHYVMEACAENQKQLVVFDRPNPNGDYVAGLVLEPDFMSFVGMHQIPVVHGCTIGELALMINSEGWLTNSVKCNIEVIPVANYTHAMRYSLPVKPSPNLPNDISIRLYPSLCFFEATNVSIGRGTHFPFQVIGYPDSTFGSFSFQPESIPGMASHPKQEGKLCYGLDLRDESLDHQFNLQWFVDFYNKFACDRDFWSSERWFNLLAGNDWLIDEIRGGHSLDEIQKRWQPDLDKYLLIRKKYLLYPEFESEP